MDKQMIEEMAYMICEMTSKCVDCSKYSCKSKDSAERLYNAGYRKIPEGGVVLKGTETEERLEDLLIEFDEMSFYPATLMPNAEECAREWKRKLIYAIGQLKKEMLKDCIESNKVARETYYKQGCKETAEKFSERLKESLDISVDGYSTSEVMSEIEDKIDVICKEIIGG